MMTRDRRRSYALVLIHAVVHTHTHTHTHTYIRGTGVFCHHNIIPSFPAHCGLNEHQNICIFIFLSSHVVSHYFFHNIIPSFPDHYRLNKYQNIYYFHIYRLTWSHNISSTPQSPLFLTIIVSINIKIFFTFIFIVSCGLKIFLP